MSAGPVAAGDPIASALMVQIAKAKEAHDALVARRAAPSQIKPARLKLAELCRKLGEQHLASGELRAAIDCARQAEAYIADNRDTAILMARARLSAKDSAGALVVLERAAEIHGKDVSVQALLAQVYFNTGRPGEAITPFRRALRLRPDDRMLQIALANALAGAGDIASALPLLEQVLKARPDDVELLARYALLCNNAGSFEKARAAFQRLTELAPRRGLYHRMFGNLHTYHADDAHIRQMEDLLGLVDPSGDDAREMHLALFHAHESLAAYDRAFFHLKSANDIRRLQLNYKPEIFASLFANIKTAFGAEPGFVPAASPRRERPIFVVGMPRSGSTLVEQILDSHPDASAAGETPAFSALVEKHFLRSNLTYDLRLLCDSAALDALGGAYLGAISGIADVGRRTVDKYLANFLSIGFIKAVFPDARIVHCHRNPLANCFSIYASHFETNGLGFKADQGQIADYYIRYVDLMDFWKARFGEDILDLSYEVLTQDQEGQTRRLLDHCQLDWHDACLDFHQNARAVNTASYIQVRQPLYSGIDRRTARYIGHLQPMIDGLRAAGLHPA